MTSASDRLSDSKNRHLQLSFETSSDNSSDGVSRSCWQISHGEAAAENNDGKFLRKSAPGAFRLEAKLVKRRMDVSLFPAGQD